MMTATRLFARICTGSRAKQQLKNSATEVNSIYETKSEKEPYRSQAAANQAIREYSQAFQPLLRQELQSQILIKLLSSYVVRNPYQSKNSSIPSEFEAEMKEHPFIHSTPYNPYEWDVISMYAHEGMHEKVGCGCWC